MAEKTCATAGCNGEVMQIDNLFLHTLGPDPRVNPDFSLFVECLVWKCTKCGSIQLYSNGEIIKAPSGPD